MAALMDTEDLVEAFLLRLPPDDPGSLVRAALVCKLWRRVLADRGFRRRFCELHRRPPMLGFLAFLPNEARSRFFTATSSFRPRGAGLLGQSASAIDSRHGRVLLAAPLSPAFDPIVPHISHTNLAVWDPVTGDRLELPSLPESSEERLSRVAFSWSAAVLCSSNDFDLDQSNACGNIGCHHGHFLVVLICSSEGESEVYVYVYSSQAGAWRGPTAAALNPLEPRSLYSGDQKALHGNALYFIVRSFARIGILKYDLGTQETSCIGLPPNLCGNYQILFATTEYGGLGIAKVHSSKINLWSREAGPGGHLGWAPSRVIEFDAVLPAKPHFVLVVAFVDGLGTFLVNTENGVFSIDLDSKRATKVCRDRCGIINVVPYTCFCTPALNVVPTNTVEGPVACVPSV